MASYGAVFGCDPCAMNGYIRLVAATPPPATPIIPRRTAQHHHAGIPDRGLGPKTPMPEPPRFPNTLRCSATRSSDAARGLRTTSRPWFPLQTPTPSRHRAQKTGCRRSLSRLRRLTVAMHAPSFPAAPGELASRKHHRNHTFSPCVAARLAVTYATVYVPHRFLRPPTRGAH